MQNLILSDCGVTTIIPYVHKCKFYHKKEISTMGIVASNEIKAKNKANGKGEITIKHILGASELNANDMYAQVTIPPGCSIGYHEHHGNAESYYILEGEALYDDNGQQMLTLTPGQTTYCPDGEGHSIENPSSDKNLVFMALISKTV